MQRSLKALLIGMFIIVSSLGTPHLAQAESCENLCAAAMEPGQVQSDENGETVTCCCLGESEPYTNHAPEDCSNL